MKIRSSHTRSGFLGVAGMAFAAAEAELTGPASAVPAFGPVKQIHAGALNAGYVEIGPANGTAVVLIHGWPYDIHSYAEVAPILAAAGYRVIVPFLRGYGSTRFLSAQTIRSGQPAAATVDTIALMDALKIKKAILGGFDWGSRTVCSVAALWPERCKAMVSVSGYLITNLKANLQPLPPKAELGWWYQYYFTTDRGLRGYAENRTDFNRLIWTQASPKWNFDDATYARTAASFDNPDHVAIVIHNYRYRLSLAKGDPQYEEIERKLNATPRITVPTITIASDFDGPNASGTSYAKLFTGKYAHRILSGVGHNVPQEAPQAFAKAVVDVDRLA